MRVLLLLVFVAGCLANDFNLQRIFREYAQPQGENTASNNAQLWFQQKLDHFFPSEQTFQQRYYVNDQYWQGSPEGPVLIYVGGEAALTSSSVTRGFIVEIAQKMNALVFGLEHRFYGLSQPFQDLTTDNLKYLSSQQGLADLAFFQANMVQQYALKPEAKWVSIGGSYPGSLSAWFRLKYPHLIAASLASSAPVHAKPDFYEYDETVRRSAGPKCADLIRNATVQVEAALKASEQSRQHIKEMFDCSEITDDVEFLYVIADMVAFAIQYKDTVGDKLCGPIESASDVLEAYAEYAHWLLHDYLGTDAMQFNIAGFTNTSWTESTNMRQWMYQSCREFGYFQTAPKEDSLRSTEITLDWHYSVCSKLFGVKMVPSTDWTNDYYGSNQTASSRIYFTNGSQDPWHVLSVQQDITPSEIAEVIQGTAHCADLHQAAASDPQSLTQARAHVLSKLQEWLQ